MTTKKAAKKRFTIERADRLEKIAQAADLEVERTHENGLRIEQGALALELAVHGKKVEVTFGPLTEQQAATVLTKVKLVDTFLKSFT